jgi:hypothetical protein
VVGARPPLFAGVLFLGVLAAEVALPRPARGRVVSATLRERRVIDYLPQPAARGLAALSGALLGLAFFGILAGLVESGFSLTDGIDLRALLRYAYYGEWQYGIGYGVTGTASSALFTIVTSLAAGLILLRLVVRSHAPARTPSSADRTMRGGDGPPPSSSRPSACSSPGWSPAGRSSSPRTSPLRAAAGFTLLAAIVGAIGLAAFSGYVVMLLRAGEGAAETEPEPAADDEPAMAARP